MNNQGYNGVTSAIAEWFWDFTDVNANMERAEYVARRVGNGIQATANFIAMFVLFLFALGLAAHFDFISTYNALGGLREEILQSLPRWTGVDVSAPANAATQGAVILVSVVTIIITVAPTLMEIFTSNLARANIGVIKMSVLGFSAFDVITDIPTTKSWIDKSQSTFDSLGPVLGFIAYYFAFFIWLLLATIGFQILTVIFGYLSIIYFKKMTVGGVVSRGGPYTMPQQPKQPQQQPKQPQAVKVAPSVVVLDQE